MEQLVTIVIIGILWASILAAIIFEIIIPNRSEHLMHQHSHLIKKNSPEI